jgi:hypothetical protein
VLNNRARDFYRKHGVALIADAYEPTPRRARFR